MSSNDAKPTVVVLMGGPDAERDVSLMSGREVAESLRESGRYSVVERTIDKPTGIELAAIGGDVVFPVLHGPWGEGGPLQDLLEEIGRPYVGSPPLTARTAMNKLATKMILSVEGVPTPPACEVQADDVICDLDPPLVLKPVDDGSSVDLRICHTPQAVATARAELHPRRSRLMAERYVPGRELTVGVAMGKPLPLIEIVPATDFYDYDAKYLRDDTAYLIEPDVPPGVSERCTALAMLAFERLGCRDIARVDFMVQDDEVWFLEINTMPGFTTHSLIPMAAARIGLDMRNLCADLVDAALQRSTDTAVLATRV